MEIVTTGVLVIGSGLAGLQAAIEARRQGCPVILVDKGPIGRSGCSIMAEQIAAAISQPDSAGAHAQDTLDAGQGLNDPELVGWMVEEAASQIAGLQQAGVVFDRGPDGRLILEAMNGHRFPRSLLYEDRTGQSIVEALRRQADGSGVAEQPDTMIVSLLKPGERVAGALGLDLAAGRIVLFQAAALVLACGGAGRLYPVTTNPAQSTGDGFALALRAGAVLRDMEFVQFYPAVLAHPPALRGMVLGISQHGRWLNGKGERFLSRLEEGERSTRDLLTREVAAEIRSGRTSPHGGIYLDLAGLDPEVYRRFRSALRLCREQGLDLTRQRAEVAPAAHYMMGGVRIDVEGRTVLPGLYAAGETAGGVHGANRLGNNSLLDALVFGARAGAAAGREARTDGRPEAGGIGVAEMADREAARLEGILTRGGRPLHPLAVRAELQRIMEHNVGIIRCREGLEKALAEIDRLQAKLATEAGVASACIRFNRLLLDFLETENLLLAARAITAAALARRESRGAHYREDFPARDDPGWRTAIAVRMENGILKARLVS